MLHALHKLDLNRHAPVATPEQLIGALNKKPFMECTIYIPGPGRHVDCRNTLSGPERNLQCQPHVSQVDAHEKRARVALHEIDDLRNSLRPVPPEVLASCGDYLRFRFRSETDRLLDSRLSILAKINSFQPEQLYIDSGPMEKICTFVSRTRRGPSRWLSRGIWVSSVYLFLTLQGSHIFI